MKRFLALVLVFLLCVFMSGCTAIGLDIENQLRPPKNNGQQEALRTALEQYIEEHNTRGEVNSYLLKYPSSGEYRSAFILLDQAKSVNYVTQNKAVSDSFSGDMGNYCVAFYRMDVDNSYTHIHLLKKEGDTWISVGDIEGYSEEIEEIDFADINGDNIPELLVGWNLYNAKDKRLAIYSLVPQAEEYPFTESYSHLTVADMTGDGADELLLFTSDTISTTTVAQLFSCKDNRIIKLDEALLDPDISQFYESVNVVFSDNVRGVFIDAYKDPQTTITELILWDNNHLESPFYSNELQITSLTARKAPLYCGDIDEDGIVEWPLLSEDSYVLSGEQSPYIWNTTWYYFDLYTRTVKHDFDSIINTQDRYSIQLTDTFPPNCSISYDEASRIMTLSVPNQPLLKIQTTESGKKADLEDGFVYFASGESLHYGVWKADDLMVLTEELQYLFSAL